MEPKIYFALEAISEIIENKIKVGDLVLHQKTEHENQISKAVFEDYLNEYYEYTKHGTENSRTYLITKVLSR